jgi:hypothetical protein
MKNLLFHLNAVKTGTLYAQAGAGFGAGAEKKIVSAPQPW